MSAPKRAASSQALADISMRASRFKCASSVGRKSPRVERTRKTFPPSETAGLGPSTGSIRVHSPRKRIGVPVVHSAGGRDIRLMRSRARSSQAACWARNTRASLSDPRTGIVRTAEPSRFTLKRNRRARALRRISTLSSSFNDSEAEPVRGRGWKNSKICWITFNPFPLARIRVLWKEILNVGTFRSGSHVNDWEPHPAQVGKLK